MTDFKTYQEYVNESVINEAKKLPPKLTKELKKHNVTDTKDFLAYALEELNYYVDENPSNAADELFKHYLSSDAADLIDMVEGYAVDESLKPNEALTKAAARYKSRVNEATNWKKIEKGYKDYAEKLADQKYADMYHAMKTLLQKNGAATDKADINTAISHTLEELAEVISSDYM